MHPKFMLLANKFQATIFSVHRINLFKEMTSNTFDNNKCPLLPIENQDSAIDPLHCKSIHFILNSALKNITVKDIQFHFRIGYNRAANILEQIKLNNQNIK